MAVEEGLKIQIGADVTELISGLAKASKSLKSFGSDGQASAKEVEKAIKELSKATKGLSGEQLERVNTLIAKLRDTSSQLGKQATVGVQALGNSIGELNKQAATVTPQIEKLSTAITNIPEGSFAVSLDADVAAYLPKIEGASEALRELGRTGIIAGDQAEKALIELGKAAETAGTADILKINAAMSAIGAASDKFKTTGVQAFDSFGKSVQEAAGKVNLISPAIAKAEQEVKVLQTQGFTIKINAETKDAIAGIRFISKETKSLAVSGEANVNQVEKAVRDLNKALKNGGGGEAEINRIKTALVGLGQISTQFGRAGKAGFDEFGNSIAPFVNKLETVAPVAKEAAAALASLPAQGFKVAIAADVSEAIKNLRNASTELQNLGIVGEANADQVTRALNELNAAAKNASGTELRNISTAIQGLTNSSEELSRVSSSAFGQVGKDALIAGDKIESITPKVNEANAAIQNLDSGNITINSAVNVAGAVQQLDILDKKVDVVSDHVQDLSGQVVNTTFTTEGVDATKAKIESILPVLDEVRAESDVRVQLTVNAQQAIQNLNLTSDVLEQLGTTGKGSINDVKIAIEQLKAAAAGASGAQLQSIVVALQNIGESSTTLGINASNGFGLLTESAESTLASLGAIPPAVQKIADVVNTVDGSFTVTPTVNEQPAINDLDQIINKAEAAKDSVEEISTVRPVISVTTSGVEESGNDVEALYERLQRLIKTGDYELDVTVDAKKAIKELGTVNDALTKLSNSGTASIHDVEDSMRFLANAAKKPGAELAKIEAAMKHLTVLSNQFKNAGKAGFDVMGRSLANATAQAKQLTPALRSAGSTLTDVGRIAQDAPFSILSGNLIAVSNNIDPLINSLRQLRAETGSTSGAFKALGTSLLGGGGIALAVSAIVAAVTLYSAKTSQAKDDTKELVDETAELGKAIADEASNVATLVTALKSETTSREEKAEIIKKLQQQSPGYFKQLKEEDGLVRGLSAAYAQYLGGLTKTLKSRSLKKQLDELFDKQLELQADIDPQIGKISPEQLKKVAKLNRQLEALGNPEIDFNKPLDQLTDLERKVLGIRAELANIKPADKFDFNNTRSQLEDVNLQIEGLLIKLDETGEFDLGLGITSQSNNALKDRINILSDLRKSVGLTTAMEQELLRLMLQDKSEELKKAGIAGEALARSLSKVKVDFQLEGIDIAIAKLIELSKTGELTGKQQGLLLDLKFEKFDLEFPDANEIQRQQSFQSFKQEVEELGRSPELLLRIPTKFDLKDTPEQIRKSITDAFPEGGFKIPISIATSVDPLPNSAAVPELKDDSEAEMDAKIEKAKKYASVISQEVAPVFASLFDTIGKDGPTALEALGDALKQITKKLIVAAAQAAIFSAIMTAISPAGSAGAIAGFGGNFLSSFKGLLGLQANLGSQNRQFVRGNMANSGRESLIAQVSGSQLEFVLRRNNTSNSRFA